MCQGLSSIAPRGMVSAAFLSLPQAPKQSYHVPRSLSDHLLRSCARFQSPWVCHLLQACLWNRWWWCLRGSWHVSVWLSHCMPQLISDVLWLLRLACSCRNWHRWHTSLPSVDDDESTRREPGFPGAYFCQKLVQVQPVIQITNDVYRNIVM